MTTIDIDQLLTPISDGSPCGEDLEYDNDYMELDQANQTSSEQQYGDTVIEATEPDWRDIRRRATELLSRTKDIRVVVHLINALARAEGIAGLADGLSLLRQLVEGRWQDIHPQLDPDDNDPTLRVNTIAALVDPDPTSGRSLPGAVRTMPLVNSRLVGVFGLREIAIANGELPAPESMKDPPDAARIDAAFTDVGVEPVQEMAEAVQRAIDDVAALDAFVTDQVGAASAVDLSELGNALKEVQPVLADQLARQGVGEGAAATEEGAGGGAAAPLQGNVNTPEDARRAIDKIIDYFQRQEPSSPVPMLLKRAKRLIAKDYFTILQELTPDGTHQAEVLRGPDTDADSA